MNSPLATRPTIQQVLFDPSQFAGAKWKDETLIDWQVRAMQAARLEIMPWLEIKDAKQDGSLIAGLITMRWKAYKPSSPQARHGIKGRWQQSNGYAGWVNAQEQPTHWLPHPQPHQSGRDK